MWRQVFTEARWFIVAYLLMNWAMLITPASVWGVSSGITWQAWILLVVVWIVLIAWATWGFVQKHRERSSR
jgi:hypothetical protein